MKTYRNATLRSILLVFCLFFGVSTAHAAVIYDNYNTGTEISSHEPTIYVTEDWSPHVSATIGAVYLKLKLSSANHTVGQQIILDSYGTDVACLSNFKHTITLGELDVASDIKYVADPPASPGTCSNIGGIYPQHDGLDFDVYGSVGDTLAGAAAHNAFGGFPAFSDMYITVCDTVSCSPGSPTLPADPYSRVIQWNYPVSGTTTPSTTFTASFDYYAGFNYADMYIVNWRDELSRQIATTSTGTLPAQGAGTASFSVTLPESGRYQGCANLFSSTTPDVLYGDSSAPGSWSSGCVQVTFSAVSNTMPNYGGISDSTFGSLKGIATTTCSILNVTGCFQNALVFLFYPSDGVLNDFSALKTVVQQKPPFGYVVVIVDQLNSLNASSTPAFTLEKEDNIFNNTLKPLRDGLAAILWLIFAFWFLNRLRHIEL